MAGFHKDREQSIFGSHFRHGITMRQSTQVRSVSFLKANAAAVLAHLNEVREPIVITQNGAAKAVIQDVASYEETQKTLTLLKILALSEREIEQGRFSPAAEAFARVRASRA